MLSVGYNLERNCPEKHGELKNYVRNALVEIDEPWASTLR